MNGFALPLLQQLQCFLLCLIALHSVAAAALAAPDPLPREIKVLLVNGRPAAEQRDEATFFLRIALNPFGDKQPPELPRVRTRVVSVAQFSDAALVDLTDYDCVFLCDVPRLGRAETQRLEALVRAGGGVVFCLGPQVQADAYNTQLYREGKGLLPVRLLERRKAKEKHFYRFAFDEAALKQPPLAVFAGEKGRGLLHPTIREYIGLSEPDPKAKVRTVLAFEQVTADQPEKGTNAGLALLEWRPFADGKDRSGRVILVTTTVNAEWNNWPLSPSFVPAVHGILQFVAADRRRADR